MANESGIARASIDNRKNACGISPVKMPYPGHRTGQIARASLVSGLILLSVLGSLGPWLPGMAQFFGTMFSSPVSQMPEACSALLSNSTAPSVGGTFSCSNSTSTNGNEPLRVGSQDVPNTPLPRSLLSTIDSVPGAGWIQNSPQNITLYNPGLSLRLIGGSDPYDVLVDKNLRVLGPRLNWGVEVNESNTWTPLSSLSSLLTVAGTNKTGTYILKSLNVNSGAYSGNFRIAYTTTVDAHLRWDLDFVPSNSGDYRIVFSWQKTSSLATLRTSSRLFSVQYGASSYTFDWSDIPPSLNSTASMSGNTFTLVVNLGRIGANSRVSVDPSLVSSSTSSGATDYQFQRKVFQDSTGRYFAFFYNGSSLYYVSSLDGLTWSAKQSMPSGWPAYVDAPTSQPSVSYNGRNVLIAAGDYLNANMHISYIANASVRYAIGTISGSSITWGPTKNVTGASFQCFFFSCNQVVGVRLVYALLNPNGDIAFTFNSYNGTGYPELVYIRGASTYTATIDPTSYIPSNPPAAAVLVPEGDPNNGVVRIVYDHAPCCVGNDQLNSVTYSSVTRSFGTVDLSNINLGSNPYLFSVASDAEYNVHVLFSGLYNCCVLQPWYLYHATGSRWTTPLDPFPYQTGGMKPSASVSVDLSTDTVYLMAWYWASQTPMGANLYTMLVMSKSPSQDAQWRDATVSYQFKNRMFDSTSGSFSIGSSLGPASSTNASRVALIWTDGPSPGPYNVVFGSIPLQTVWSPYAYPSTPWDGNGLVPNEQYSQNLGESVAPGSGSLTVSQTDLSLPGRTINFEISRVFTGTTIQYSQAPVGSGWQLTLPSYDPYSQQLHLWNGQSYRYPINWNQGPCSPSCVWENHQGDHFRLVMDTTSQYDLVTKSGLIYRFNSLCNGNCYWRLSSLIDPTGNNTITFGHDSTLNNEISSATDATGRQFLFCYDRTNNLITSIEQVSGGGCGSETGLARKVSYSYNGQSLSTVTDPANRQTSFLYNGASPVGLVTRVTYSTGWYSNYTYVTETLGSGSTGYRVSQQILFSNLGAAIRKFSYTYYEDSGTDQVTRTTITAYNGTSTQPAAYTDYAFSYSAIKWNMSDAAHNLVRGVIQSFGVQGTIPQETFLVTDGTGLSGSSHIGSFTNFYSYDLWGNLIYSRESINQPTNNYHERLYSYYNNGLPLGFDAFQDSFSQNNKTASNNAWKVQSGYWMVKNGFFNGTQRSGQQESVFAWSDIGKSDISLQTSVYITQQSNSTAGAAPRVGIFTHYPGSGTNKWVLVLIKHSDGTQHLDLFDEWGQMLASPSCNFVTGAWYTFNMTVHGTYATGWASTPGQPQCPSVSGNFPSSSPAIGGTGFGLYAGGYSALFDNVTVTTVAPGLTGTGFTNSFYPSGAPNSNIHGLLAGTAQLQNGVLSLPEESYYSYTPWGELNQTKTRYDPPATQGTSNPITLDGSALGNCSNTTSSCSATISTSHGNDMIVVYASETLDLQTTCSFTVSDTSGLSWFNRGPSVSGRGGRDQLQEFLARSLSALSSDVITESITGCGTNYNGLVVFGITGANLSVPLDPSLGVPGTGSDAIGGQQAVTSATISTGNPSDFVFAGVQHGTGATATAQSGLTLITSGGFGYGAEYGVTSSIVSSYAVTFSFSTSSYWEQTADAVQSSLPTQWLTSSRTYDVYGNLKTLTDPRGNVTSYGYSTKYLSAYLTSLNQTLAPGGTLISKRYGYDATTGTMLFTVDPNGYNTTYQYDILGRLTRTNYPTTGAITPQVDGSGIGACSNTTTSCPVTLTTSHANDIIIVFTAEALDAQTSPCTFSVSDTVGLSWTARSAVVYGRTNLDELQEWWAKSTGALTSDTITESIAGCGNNYNGLQVFAISGANFNSPFDPSTGVPGTGSDAGSGQQAVTSAIISTANPNDFVFAGVQHGAVQVSGAQSGFTLITSGGFGFGTEYELSSSTLANFAVTFSFSTSSYWQEIADAVQVSPASNYVGYAYSDTGSYVDISNENGWKTRQNYDGLGRLSSVQRFFSSAPLSSVYSTESYTRNWQDKIINRIDPLGNTYNYMYDALGRLTQTKKPDGNSTRATYNDLQSWIVTSDEYGNNNCRTYDRLGRLLSMVEYSDPNCNPLSLAGGVYVTNYYYDEVGNLVKVTNAATKSTTYSYDNLNRLTVTSYPDGMSETYGYDNNGNVVKKVDKASIKTLSSYDSLNRVSATTYCGTTIIGTSYVYDKNSNPLQILNQNATVSYIYDSRNRVLNETYAANPTTRTVVDLGCSGSGGSITRTGGVAKTYHVGWTYNGELLNTLMYPTIYSSNPDITIKYAYDGLGRVLNVNQSGTSSYYARSFTYYRNDQVKGFQFGNNLIQNYTYDSLSRASTITLSGTTTMSLSYAYNNTGTVASVTGQVNAATVNEQYRYDPLQRLTNSSVASSGSTTTLWYEYDNLGNRVRQKLNGTITRYSYNSVNELTNSTTYSAPQTTVAYSYDPDGNMKTRNVTSTGTVRWLYTWDATGRLLTVTNSTGQVQYAYDGMGRMVEAAEGGAQWFIAYTGSQILYKNHVNLNNYEYVYAAGLRIVLQIDRTAPSTYYFHSDALGSVRMITYSDSTSVYTDNYQPFGQDNGTPKGSYRDRAVDKFVGERWTAATSLYYDFQRWYDPTIGRFISQDPFAGHLSHPQTLNPYVYVDDSPTSSTDPTGMDGGFGADNRCEKLHQCSSAGPDPLLTGVSNWWNGLPTWAKVTIVVAVVVVAIVATAGIAAPELLPAMIPLLVGDASWLGGGLGLCAEDPVACEPPPSTVNPPSITTPGTGTASLVDTSSFFAGADLTTGTIDSSTLLGLRNGMPVPSASVSTLVDQWVGPDAISASSGTGTRYFSEPSPGVLQQARIDYGQIGQEEGVYRVVLERYIRGVIQLKIHLPIIG